VVSTLITEEDLCDVETTPPVRSCADPLLGCRPKGSVSRFWVLSDDEFSDADSGPSMLEMVQQAAVYGLLKEDLVLISKNLNCPTILSWSCASVSPSSCEKLQSSRHGSSSIPGWSPKRELAGHGRAVSHHDGFHQN
jgi:hypothetical protein